jgi:hypothetical protein
MTPSDGAIVTVNVLSERVVLVEVGGGMGVTGVEDFLEQPAREKTVRQASRKRFINIRLRYRLPAQNNDFFELFPS